MWRFHATFFFFRPVLQQSRPGRAVAECAGIVLSPQGLEKQIKQRGQVSGASMASARVLTLGLFPSFRPAVTVGGCYPQSRLAVVPAWPRVGLSMGRGGGMGVPETTPAMLPHKDKCLGCSREELGPMPKPVVSLGLDKAFRIPESTLISLT